MGATMVSDPEVVVFAGGIGRGGTMVEASVDAFSGLRGNSGEGASARREVLS